MKKVSVFTLMVILAIGLIACSNENEKVETDVPTKLTFWTPLSGGDGDFMKELVKKFNDESNEIEVEILNLKSEEYYTKLRASVTSKQAPDIALSHTSKLSDLQSTNLIESMDDFAKKANIDWSSFSENIVNATVIDGKHYAIPLDTHALVMYINKKILDDAGLLDDSGNPTFEPGAEGFMNFLEEIKNKSPDGIFPLSATSNGDSPLRIWWTLYSQLGGKLLSEAGTEAAFNNEKSIKALQYMNEMIENDFWPRNIKNGGEIFTAQKAAIHLNGVWMTGALEQNEDLDFAAIPIPKLFDQQATWGDSHIFVLPTNESSDNAKKVAGLKFANWIADHSALWAKAGHVPSKPAILETPEFTELPYRSDYTEIADYVTYMPNTPALSAITDILKRHLDLSMNGQVNAEDTFINAEKEVNELLSK